VVCVCVCVWEAHRVLFIFLSIRIRVNFWTDVVPKLIIKIFVVHPALLTVQPALQPLPPHRLHVCCGLVCLRTVPTHFDPHSAVTERFMKDLSPLVNCSVHDWRRETERGSAEVDSAVSRDIN
jgi:hypothetical protein